MHQSSKEQYRDDRNHKDAPILVADVAVIQTLAKEARVLTVDLDTNIALWAVMDSKRALALILSKMAVLFASLTDQTIMVLLGLLNLCLQTCLGKCCVTGEVVIFLA